MWNMRQKYLLPVLLLSLLSAGCAGGLSRREASRLYYNLGNAYLDLGESGKASEAYLKALEYDEKMKIASFNLAKAYIEVEKYIDALAVLDSMLKDEPENVIILSAKAYCIYRYGNFEKAYEIYDTVLKIDPGNIEALYNSSAIKFAQEDYSSALEKLSVLKNKKIDDEDLLNKVNFSIGEIYYKTEQFEEALKYLEFIKQKDPQNLKNLEMLFNSYVIGRSFASAAETGNLILSSQPENKVILFEMAVVYLTAIEDFDSGIRYLEKSIASGFDDKEKAGELINSPGLEKKDVILKLLKKGNLLDD